MLTMLQTAAYYLDVAKAERAADADVKRTLIFNGMTIADVAEYRERRLRHRELVAQREALGTVLELNASPGVEVEALPLLPVEEPDAQQAARETAIRIFAIGESELPESDAYPDTYLVLLPPSADCVVRDQPVALTLTREELGRLTQLARTALLDGSVLGALQAGTEPMAAAVPVLAAPGATPATEPATESNETEKTEEKAS